MPSKSKNKDYCDFFPMFTEGIGVKLIELESESDSFLSKVENYHVHLPITTFPSCIGKISTFATCIVLKH